MAEPMHPSTGEAVTPVPSAEILARDGYVVLPDLLSRAEVDALRVELAPASTPARRGGRCSRGCRRAACTGWSTKSRAFDDLVLAGPVLGLVEQVLGESCLLSAALGHRHRPG